MALYLAAKAPEAIYRYTWAVPIAEGDSVSATTASVTDGTAVLDSYEVIDNSVVLVISGGAAGEVTTIEAEATSADGETLFETIYLPVISSANALANTGQGIAAYILRKVSGIGESADADEVDDVLERVSDMLAAWKLAGADIGIPLPVTTATEFVCEDAYIQAIKTNGILAAADLYEYQVSPVVAEQARRGLALVKNSLLSRDTLKAEYY